MILSLFLSAWAAEPELPPQPAFGSDVSVGYTVGALLGSWPDGRPDGSLAVRMDFFPVDRDTAGPRIGASLWARTSMAPLPLATEVINGEPEQFSFRYQAYGMHVVFRFEPDAPWTGTFGMGFSRTDIEDWYDGVQAVPMFSVEGGVRRKLPGEMFIDLMVQNGYGNARGAEANWEEWWSVNGTLMIGAHVR